MSKSGNIFGRLSTPVGATGIYTVSNSQVNCLVLEFTVRAYILAQAIIENPVLLMRLSAMKPGDSGVLNAESYVIEGGVLCFQKISDAAKRQLRNRLCFWFVKNNPDNLELQVRLKVFVPASTNKALAN